MSMYGRVLFEVFLASLLLRGALTIGASALIVCRDGFSFRVFYSSLFQPGFSPGQDLVVYFGEEDPPKYWSRHKMAVPEFEFWEGVLFDQSGVKQYRVTPDLIRELIIFHGGEDLDRIPSSTQRVLRELMENVPSSPCPSREEIYKHVYDIIVGMPSLVEDQERLSALGVQDVTPLTEERAKEILQHLGECFRCTQVELDILEEKIGDDDLDY